MDYITLLIGLFIGLVLMGLYARAQGGVLRERLAQRESELTASQTACAELTQRHEALERSNFR
jgi:hypothetical protein